MVKYYYELKRQAIQNYLKRHAIKTMTKIKSSKTESQRILELEIQLRRAQVEIECLKELRRLRKTNQEKVEIIRTLHEHYTLIELLETIGLEKSSYFMV